MKRNSFPEKVVNDVLIKCKRRCTLCLYLENDLRWKKGQLAHIDRNHSNASAENAVYLCTPHHDEYDSRPSQTKRLTPAEVKVTQMTLHELLASPDWIRFGTHSSSRGRRRVHGISLDIYERRIPFYRATLQFVRDVITDLKPETQLILKFSADTDEALFLFDDTVAGYLDELFRKALRLHTISKMTEQMLRGGPMDRYQELVQEETDLSLWFTSQYQPIRNHFYPFLRLAS
jgi:hypothetical protein